MFFFFFSSRRRHTRWNCDWSSDVCSSDLLGALAAGTRPADDVSGYVFIAFKPGLFLPPADYRREVSRRIDTIKATPRQARSEERRVGKECRSRWSAYH